ncbi:MAG: hypothetical protein AB2768_19495 [Candidatus Thiodiazotropha endolucinida]
MPPADDATRPVIDSISVNADLREADSEVNRIDDESNRIIIGMVWPNVEQG